MPENGRPGNKSVGAGGAYVGDIVYFDAPVDLKRDGLAAGAHPGVDLETGPRQFVKPGGNEMMVAEPRHDRHDQHQVELGLDVVPPDRKSKRMKYSQKSRNR